jgi:peptidoglycan/LPS O-acetylase OafA/YrhL
MPLVGFLDSRSFGVYLLHSPLIYVTFTFFAASNPWLVFAINFLIGGGIALALTSLLKTTPLRFLIGDKNRQNVKRSA